MIRFFKDCIIHLSFVLCLLYMIALGGCVSSGIIGAAGSVEGGLEPFLGDPVFGIEPVFQGERFGNIVVTMKGTLVATWGREYVRAKRSEDGGKTWGPEILIAKPGFQSGGLTVNEVNGEIIAFVEDHHPPAVISVYRSSDDGKSWNKIKTNINPDAKGHAPSMHMNEHGITLRHGKYKGRLIRPSRWYAGKNEKARWPKHYTNAIFSDDGGQTWHTSDPFPANGTGEATLAELSDGTIYYNSRRHWAEEGANPRRRWTATSHDGGKTWKDLQFCEVLPDGPQDTNYGCMGGLTRLAVKGRDILIYSNCDSPKGRTHGTVWASFDGGKTWPVKRLVFAGKHAYSSMTSGRPGTSTEGMIFHHFEGGPKGGSAVARFNLSWLLKGVATGNGEIPGWVK